MKYLILVTLLVNSAFYSQAQLFGGQILGNKNWELYYTSGTVFCSLGPTAVVEVTNPTTGKTWMDRNLGASQMATSITDAAAYGDSYQWGRGPDGHQCRTSAIINTLSSTDQPGHGDFINTTAVDWTTTYNPNRWQGLSGINNPCPIGFRIPTSSELEAERLSWGSNDNSGAFSSPLKLPAGGWRFNGFNGAFFSVGGAALYWCSTINGNQSYYLEAGLSNSAIQTQDRSNGMSVRCIKN